MPRRTRLETVVRWLDARLLGSLLIAVRNTLGFEGWLVDRRRSAAC